MLLASSAVVFFLGGRPFIRRDSFPCPILSMTSEAISSPASEKYVAIHAAASMVTIKVTRSNSPFAVSILMPVTGSPAKCHLIVKGMIVKRCQRRSGKGGLPSPNRIGQGRLSGSGSGHSVGTSSWSGRLASLDAKLFHIFIKFGP